MVQRAIRSVLCILVLLSVIRPADAAINRSRECGGSTPVAGNDNPPWPEGPTRIDVLANDYDPNGDALYVSSVSQPASGGATAVTSDSAAVNFTPFTGATSATFTYTVKDAAGMSAIGSVTLSNGVVNVPPLTSVSFSYTCDSSEAGHSDCSFKATPTRPDGIRSLTWTFPEQTNCSKEWRGLTHVCRFTPLSVAPGASDVQRRVQVSVNYHTGEVVSSGMQTINVPRAEAMAVWTGPCGESTTGSSCGSLRTSHVVLDTNLAEDGRLWWRWDASKPQEVQAALSDNSHLYPEYRGHVNEHLYEEPGIYTVSLLVKEGDVFVKEMPKTFEVRNKPPTPDFTHTVSYNTAEFTTARDMDEFDGGLPDPDQGMCVGCRINHPKAIKEYQYSFGDGTTIVSPRSEDFHQTHTIEHTYAQRGTYAVTLTAVDHFGAVGSITKDVVIANVPPTAKFTYNCHGFPAVCAFDARGSSDDDAIVKYEWSYENGAYAEGAVRQTHTFGGGTPERFVSVRVTDSNGVTSTFGQFVNVNYAAVSNANFFSVPPCRLYDSGTELVGNGNVLVPARGRCGIPAGTDEMSYVVTVALPSAETGAGYVSTAGGGVMRFTNAMLPLAFHTTARSNGSSPDLHLVVYPRARVVIDVVGYYRASDAAPAAPARGPYRFTTVAPCRVIDSRQTGPQLTAASRLDVGVAGTCGVEPGAVAVASSLAAVTPSLTVGAHIRMWPSNLSDLTPTSALNLINGVTRANSAVTELGSAQGHAKDVALWLNTGSSHYVLDAYGYYSPASKLRYTQLASAVRLEWEHFYDGAVTVEGGAQRSFRVRGAGSIPMHAAAVLVQAEISQPAVQGHLALFAGDQEPGTASVLNFHPSSPAPVMNTVIVPLATTGEADLGALVSLAQPLKTAKLKLQVLGYFADPASWGAQGANVDWSVTGQDDAVRRVSIDVTALSIDEYSPEHRYTIDWGDGSTPSAFNTGRELLDATLQKTYAAAGTYDVTVSMIRRSDNAQAKFTKKVLIPNAKPVANFTSLCERGARCRFDASSSTDDRNGILEYRWTYGDGLSETVATPIAGHAYALNDVHSVTLVVWDGTYASAPVTKLVNQNVPPVAQFTFDCWGTNCNFDASGSTDEGAIATYEWKFLGTQPFAAGQRTMSYAFAAAGDYPVQLQVTDDRGAKTTTTRTVLIRTAGGMGNANYFAIPQCRIYDSTNPVSSGSIPIRGACGIPAGSDALVPVLNIAIVTSNAGSGTLTLSGDRTVQFSSTQLPLAIHRVPLLAAGQASVPFTVTLPSRIIADVVGYYSPSEATAVAPARGPFRFTPLHPCRVIDSRTTPPELTGTVRLDITVTGKCGVPADAAATAQTLAAVSPNTPSFPAHIRLFSSEQTALPPTSALNILHSVNRSNFFISEIGTPYGAATDLALWLSTGTSHFVLDAHGYFSTASKHRYTQLAAPVPVSSTALQSDVVVTHKVRGHAGVPKHATAAVVQVDAGGTTGGGYLTLYAADRDRPATGVVNFVAAQSVTNTVIVPLAQSADADLAAVAKLFNGTTVTVALTVLGYFSDPAQWGPAPVNIEWEVAAQIGLRLDLDVTAISLDKLDPDYTYFVDWGDGTPRWTAQNGNDLLEATPSHTYATTGARTVSVGVVRRSDGAEVRFPKSLRIGNAAPVATLTFDCTFAPKCTFDASASTDDYNEIQKYFWDFPGASYTTTTPYLEHTFSGDGDHNVVMTAWDGVNESAAVYRSLQVRSARQRTPLLFQPIAPCRLLDTRTTAPLTDGVESTVKVTEGTCGVPANAKAVALTTAVVTPSNAGYVRLYAPGQKTLFSTQTFEPATSPRSNHATTAIGADGKIAMIANIAPAGVGTTHLIVDVTGYYIAEGTGIAPATGLGFRTLTPCRIRDSRNTSPPSPLISGSVSSIRIRGLCGLPENFPTEGGAAAALNLTAVMPATFGNITMVPSTSTDNVSTSTVNVLANRNTAGGATMGLGARPEDDLTLRYVSTGPGNATHWVLDTTGYWAVGNELRYYPIPGCRTLDTRQFQYGVPRLVPGADQRVQIRGNCGVPSWAKAVMVNATSIGGDTGGNLLLWPAGTPMPATSIVNWVAGEPAIGNMTIVPLGASLPDVSARTVQSGVHVVLDVVGYFARPADVPATYITTEEGAQEQ